MSLLDKIERRFGRLAIPHLALWIVAGQFFVLICFFLGRVELDYFVLVPDLVKHGQWWRLISFVFYPPPPGVFGYVFTAFAWYMFYLMSSALESYWGEFRFNLFIFVGCVLTAAAAFLTPAEPTLNLFIGSTVFLAFAWLNPEFTILIFFILPVKIKWLARLTWVLYVIQLSAGSWHLRFTILASVANFLLFFGADILRTFGYHRRSMGREARVIPGLAKVEARHRCYICGKTDVTNPELDFRYCSKCTGDQCYCPEHIFNHTHVLAADEAKSG